jgi:hypothetical protein
MFKGLNNNVYGLEATEGQPEGKTQGGKKVIHLRKG